jgi:hypothetical protein
MSTHMTTIQDDALGELRYDGYWIRPYRLELFGKLSDVTLMVIGDEDSPIEDAQREAYLAFEKNKADLLSIAERAVFSHYQKNCAEYRRRVGPALADKVAPLIQDPVALGSIVRPKEVVVRESFGEPDRVVGISFDCTWDPDLGIAVKFVNEQLNDFGTQHILF